MQYYYQQTKTFLVHLNPECFLTIWAKTPGQITIKNILGKKKSFSDYFFILKNFTKEYFFNNIKIKNLDNYTNSNIRDSRDKNNNLSYLSGDKKLKEIVNCEVINLKDGKEQLVKLKELL